jgi:hypothetical protein
MRDRKTSKEIRDILYGVVLSDGHIDLINQRFDLYNKQESYIYYIADVLKQISGCFVRAKYKEDSRGYIGYRTWTRRHSYFKTLGEELYPYGVKALTKYNVSRLSAESIAHIWMCDGSLQHVKNKARNTVQNKGVIHFQSFSVEENTLLLNHIEEQFNIKGSLHISDNKAIGGKHNLITFYGKNLQKLISSIYPYILDDFKYKTILFYKDDRYVDYSLPSAEQYIAKYNSIDDIVRHPLKSGIKQEG